RMISFKGAHCPGAPTELLHKKRRTQTFRMPQSRSVCAFPWLQILAFAGMALYNKTGHEHTSRGGRASDGCRPKLHRWPFSVLCLVSSAIPLYASPAFLHNREQNVPTVAITGKDASADAYTV